LARRLALVVAAAIAVLCAVPAAEAAQSIGVTRAPESIVTVPFKTFGGSDGIAVRFKGEDGTSQEVRVHIPPDFGGTPSKLRVRFDDAPANTTYSSCYPYDSVMPAGFMSLHTAPCVVLSQRGFVATLVQAFAKRVPDFGGSVTGALYDIYVSARPIAEAATTLVVPNPAVTVNLHQFSSYTVPGLYDTFPDPDSAILQAYPRWSKYYSGSLKASATKHFPVLFGSLTFAGVGVYGPGNRYGAPTNSYGRNIYIDTLDSDYGKGWRRIMGVLTQPTNGTFCYEFSKKGGSGGKTGISASNTYRLTAIGPSLTPVVRVEFRGPTFPYGTADYNPLTDKWGTDLSPEQTAALQLQATVMGPNWARPVKGTDCAKTLRQLPESFYTPVG
jgi:hypothetical protein